MEHIGKYLKYNGKTGDVRSWKIGEIYKVREDGSIPFNRDLYKHDCDNYTLCTCINLFDEVSEEEWNIQEGIVKETLIFN